VNSAVSAVPGAGPHATTLRADALDLVNAYAPPSHEQYVLQLAFLSFLLAREDAMWRSCVPGHVTASTAVIDPDERSILLTLHPRVGLWVQVGGHCEFDDLTVAQAAQREAVEETGIADLVLDERPIGLDLHPVNCSLGVPSRHFDMLFMATASRSAMPVRSEESLDLRWFGWDELPMESADQMSALVAMAQARLEGRT